MFTSIAAYVKLYKHEIQLMLSMWSLRPILRIKRLRNKEDMNYDLEREENRNYEGVCKI